MAIEIGPGWTIGGGISIVPPPTVATSIWFTGGINGNGPLSSVDRINFTTDTATATSRGTLNTAASQLAGAGTLASGWFAGGIPNRSYNQLITYSTDTATAALRGSLSTAVSALAATSDGTTYGWWAGGFTGGDAVATVQRTTYATDTASTVSRGSLSVKRMYFSGTGTTQYGWVVGGNIWAPSYAVTDIIDRITYATDTATASTRGPTGYAAAGISSVTDGTTYGWWAGGNGTPNPFTSRIYRTTFSTDTAAASSRGTLSAANSYLAGSGNDTYGWIGGSISPDYGSTVQRITYATDTTATSTRGPLTYNTARNGAASGAI